MAALTRDGVEAPVHAVNEIDVRHARWTEQVRRACRETSGGVAGGIVGTDIGFGLDDPSTRDPFWRRALEDRAEQFARHDLGGPIVECVSQRRPETRTPRDWRGVSTHEGSLVAATFFARGFRGAAFFAAAFFAAVGAGAAGADVAAFLAGRLARVLAAGFSTSARGGAAVLTGAVGRS